MVLVPASESTHHRGYLAAASRQGREFAPTAATTVRARNLGPVQIVHTKARLDGDSPAAGYVDPGDAFVWCVTTNGAIAVESSFEVVVPQGEMRLGYMPRIEEFRTTVDWRAISIRLDRSALALSSAEIDSITRATFPVRNGVPFLLGALATQAMRDDVDLGGASSAALARSLLDLTTSFADDYFGRRSSPDTMRGSLVVAARRHIELYAADPGLDPTSVADAVQVSLRALQKAFEQERATVAGTILEQRLQRAYALLQVASSAGASIEQIGRRSGFASASSFSRAFRARFDMTPREWRERSSASASDPGA